MYNVHRFYSLRAHLETKVEFFMRQGHNFFHFSGMSFSFITKFNNMTYKYCLKQPKSMLEKKLFETLSKNPGLMPEVDRTIYHPLTHAFGPIQDEDEKF